MDLNIRVLGSTSSGNCTVMWDSSSAMNHPVHGRAIMIDCGFSPRYINHNLTDIELDISSLSGVLITHTHSDHIKRSMLKRLVKEQVPVFCHEGLRAGLVSRYRSLQRADDLGLLKTFDNEEFSSGPFSVMGFEVPHDSAGGCFGFNIFKKLRSGIKKITIATDLGYPHDGLIERFVDSDIIIIESNHDTEMLESSGRPRWLKQRIRDIGHLSNDQCACFLNEVVNRSSKLPEAVILAHISQECNNNDLAGNRMHLALNSNGRKEIKVILTHRREANEILRLE